MHCLSMSSGLARKSWKLGKSESALVDKQPAARANWKIGASINASYDIFYKQRFIDGKHFSVELSPFSDCDSLTMHGLCNYLQRSNFTTAG